MVIEYENTLESDWDDFVINESVNGNFLQTRRFLNYHPVDRFQDASLVFRKDDKIAAVIPANLVEAGTVLLAHQGSTYGGLIVGKDFANTTNYKWIFEEMTAFFREKGYKKVELRMHNWLYSPCEKKHELLDYFFQLYGFTVRSEVGFYIDLDNMEDDYVSNFEKLKRRKLNKAMKNGLEFRKLSSDREIEEYYGVLKDNMKKFQTVPVHTLSEWMDFKNSRLKDEISFYGVYKDSQMIAGSMVFNFCNHKVFHTQYLASRQEYLELCPNEFLYANLIRAALDEKYHYISYGTSSLEHGAVYNEGLGLYKEGFNTDTYLNRCYIWENKSDEG